MNIRKGKPEDMHAVLGHSRISGIWKERLMFLVTVDDLIRDGFSCSSISYFLLQKLKMMIRIQVKEIVSISLYYYQHFWKTIHLEDLVVKDKCVVLVWATRCILKL
jgi:hypothetical protein